jgi:hypothetical protein
MIELALLLHGGIQGVIHNVCSGGSAAGIGHRLENCVGAIAVPLEAVVAGKVALCIGGTSNIDPVAVVLIATSKRLCAKASGAIWSSPPEYNADHGDGDPGYFATGEHFIVFGRPTPGRKPGESPLTEQMLRQAEQVVEVHNGDVFSVGKRTWFRLRVNH